MTRHAPVTMRGDAGLTLLELVVVMSILAMAAILALPSAERSRRGLALESAATQLAAGLKSARAEAVRSNRETALVLDLQTRRFTAAGQARVHGLPREVTVAYEVPAGEQPVEGRAFFRFHPDGSSSGGLIRLARERQRATVAVDWLTGRTSVAWGR